MDTKSVLIEVATKLFQQKGYKGVGLNEIIQTCGVTKGALYHHFPNGKEALLITCLQALHDGITTHIDSIFLAHETTRAAMQEMIKQLIQAIEVEGTVAGHTFSSIVSEMATLSETVRTECNAMYEQIAQIYVRKLRADGYAEPDATAISMLMVSSIEGAMQLCLTQNSSAPLKTISAILPKLLKENFIHDNAV